MTIGDDSTVNGWAPGDRPPREEFDAATSTHSECPARRRRPSAYRPGEQLLIAPTTPWKLDADAAREHQAIEITELDERHRKTLPTIIAGDLNASPETASIRYLTGLQSLHGRSVHYNDAWTVAGDGPGYT